MAGPEGLQGLAGPAGIAGAPGIEGRTGSKGAEGSAGVPGQEGTPGVAGVAGREGGVGNQGATGPEGPKGTTGATGPEGQKGSSAYAEFYALMPGDNAATVGAGMPVEFPRNGPTSKVITRRDSGEFVLPAIGVYRVDFSVSTNEPGQLVIALDPGAGMVEIPYTVYGRATGTSLISGEAIIETSAADSAVEVRNAAGNTPALTITPYAGGTHPVVASLLIEQVG